MNGRPGLALVLVMVLGSGACGGVTVPDGETLVLTPTAPGLKHPGDTVRLVLTGSASGAATWSSSDPSVATVVGGLVTATGYGRATIRAAVGGAEATAAVQVVGEAEFGAEPATLPPVRPYSSRSASNGSADEDR